MADNRRQIALDLAVSTTNAESITRLQDSVKLLAKEGTQLAPAFLGVDAALGKMAEQATKLQVLEKVAPQLLDVSEKQQLLKTSAKQLSDQLDVLNLAVTATGDKLNESKTKQRESVAAYQDAMMAVKLFNVGIRDEGDTLSGLTAQLAAAQKARNAMRVEVEQNTQASKAANAAAAEQEKALKAVNTELKGVTRDFTSLNEQARSAAAGMEAAGGAVGNLSAKQSALQAGILETRLALVKLTESQAALVAQEKQDTQAKAAYAERLAGINSIIALRRQQTVETEKAAAAEAAAEKAAAAVAKKEAADALAAHLSNLNTRLKAVQQDAAAEQQAVRDRTAAERASADQIAATQLSAHQQFMESINARIRLSQQEATSRTKAAKDTSAAEQQASKESATAQAQHIANLNTQLQFIRQQQAALAAEATRTGEALDNALRLVGGKSATAIREEIALVRQSMSLLSASGQVTGRELQIALGQGEQTVKNLERELRAATGTMTLMDKAASAMQSTVGQLSAFFSLQMVVQQTATAFYNAVKGIQSMQLGLKAVYGDAGTAAKQIEFLRTTADSAGVSVGELSKPFTKFSAALSLAGTSTTTTNEIFKEVIRVSGLLGSSSEQTARALEALSQMAAKGVVSQEEVRRQLGDSLPIAANAAAKGLQMTTEQMNNLISSGSMMFRTFGGGLLEGLKQFEGQNNTLAGAVGRLGNQITKLYQSASDSAAITALTAGLNSLAANFTTVTSAVYELGKGFLALKFADYLGGIALFGGAASKAAVQIAASTTATAENTLANQANTASLAQNAQARMGNAAAWAGIGDALKGMGGAARAASGDLAAVGGAAAGAGAAAAGAAAQKGLLATAIGGVAAAGRGLMSILGGPAGLIFLTATYAKDIGELAGKFSLWISGNKSLEESTKQLAAEEAKRQAAYAEAAREKERLAEKEEVAITKNVAALKLAVTAAEAKANADEKGTEAAKRKGETLTVLAGIQDNEVVKLENASAAAELSAEASKKEAESKLALVEAIKEEVAKREQLLLSYPKSEKLKADLKTEKERLANTQEEAKASANLAEKLQLEADQRKLNIELYKDNSGKLNEYRKGLEDAQKTVKDLIEAEKDGLPVADALKQARKELAVAERLYADSVKDSVDILKASNTLQKAESDKTVARLDLRKAELEGYKSLMAASKDANGVKYATIEVMQVEIQITEAKMAAVIKEQNSIIEQIKLQRELAQATGQMTTVKDLEYQASIASAEAKKIEAQATIKATDIKRGEILALENNTNAHHNNTSARDTNTVAASRQTKALEKLNAEREREISAQEKANALIERKAELERKYWGVDKEGFSTDSSGKKAEQSAPYERYVYDTATSQGLSKEVAMKLTDTFWQNGKGVNPTGRGDWFSAVNKAISQAYMESQRNNGLLAGKPMVESTKAPQNPATPVEDTSQMFMGAAPGAPSVAKTKVPTAVNQVPTASPTIVPASTSVSPTDARAKVALGKATTAEPISVSITPAPPIVVVPDVAKAKAPVLEGSVPTLQQAQQMAMEAQAKYAAMDATAAAKAREDTAANNAGTPVVINLPQGSFGFQAATPSDANKAADIVKMLANAKAVTI